MVAFVSPYDLEKDYDRMAYITKEEIIKEIEVIRKEVLGLGLSSNPMDYVRAQEPLMLTLTRFKDRLALCLNNLTEVDSFGENFIRESEQGFNEQTKLDLNYIRQREKEIDSLKMQVSEIRYNCNHLDTEPVYIETMGFDCAPKLRCVVCRAFIDGISEEQKISLLREHWNDVDCELTEEVIKRDKDGFDI